MKKIYIRPITEKFATEVAQLICASPQYTLKRYGQWGAPSSVAYGSDQWQIEGFQGEQATTVGGFDAVDIEDNTDPTLPSRANEGLW